MSNQKEGIPAHPLGEPGLVEKADESGPFLVDTFGGRVQVDWDPDAAVTPLGQLAFLLIF
jgi:hypothetical protein